MAFEFLRKMLNRKEREPQEEKEAERSELEQEVLEQADHEAEHIDLESGFDYLNVAQVEKWMPEAVEHEDFGETVSFKTSGGDFEIPKRIHFYTQDEYEQKWQDKEQVVHYEVGKLLGAGAMGAVVEAYPVDERGNAIAGQEPVVVKLTSDHGDGDSRRRRLREIALHAALHPERIIEPTLSEKIREEYMGTRDTDSVEGLPSFIGATRFEGDREDETIYATAIEKIEGVDLDTLRTKTETDPETGEKKEVKHPVEPKVAMEMMLSVARTVMEMHDRGILHRDIKPENIMVDPARPGEAKLIDLGIGKDLMAEMISVDQEELRLMIGQMDELEDYMREYTKEKQEEIDEMDETEAVAMKRVLEEQNVEFGKIAIEFRKKLEKKAINQVEEQLNRALDYYNEVAEAKLELDDLEFEDDLSKQSAELSFTGSPLYMSPDAMGGALGDPLIDVYSLGVTFGVLTDAFGVNEGDRPEAAPTVQGGDTVAEDIKVKTEDRKTWKKPAEAEDAGDKDTTIENGSKYTRLMFLKSEGKFIQPYPKESLPYKEKFVSESDQEFGDLCLEMAKPVVRKELQGLRQKVESRAGFLSAAERANLGAMILARSESRRSPLELDLQSHLMEMTTGKPSKEQEEALLDLVEKYIEEKGDYFDQKAGVELERLGMRHVVNRLEQIIAKKDAELGLKDEEAKDEYYEKQVAAA